MKRILTVLLSLSLLSGAVSFATAADCAGKKKCDECPSKAEMIKKFDKDNNGKLDKAEKKAAKQAMKECKKACKQEGKKKDK